MSERSESNGGGGDTAPFHFSLVFQGFLILSIKNQTISQTSDFLRCSPLFPPSPNNLTISIYGRDGDPSRSSKVVDQAPVGLIKQLASERWILRKRILIDHPGKKSLKTFRFKSGPKDAMHFRLVEKLIVDIAKIGVLEIQLHASTNPKSQTGDLLPIWQRCLPIGNASELTWIC
jgi:hypothetical protein